MRDTRDTFARKFEVWKSRLLDLSRRNRLLYFKPTKTAVRLLDPDPGQLFTHIVVRERKLRFPSVDRSRERDVWSDDEDEDNATAREIPGDLSTEVDAAELNRRLYRLYRDYRSTVAEQGVHTLFLALGFLEWQEAEEAEATKAPLVLVPVDLSRESFQEPYTLGLADEEPTLNPTLVYKLEHDFGISLPQPDLQSERFGVTHYLRQVEEAVSPLGWKVWPEAWLTRLSFEKLVIYEDLEARREQAASHPIVKALAEDTSSPPDLSDCPTYEDLDETTNVPDLFPVLDADSSQMEALVRARDGQNLVLYGPPGTGKSQTIANLIAMFLRNGKRVLFVSEKMAALEVVQRRLQEVGLERAILEVHSHKASKRAVIDELARTLSAERQPPLPRVEDQFRELQETVRQLNEYVRELHLPRDADGRSAYQVLGQLSRLGDVPDVAFRLPWASVLSTSAASHRAALQAVRRLASIPQVIDSYHDHPFKDWQVSSATTTDRSQIRALLEELHELSSRMAVVSSNAAHALGLPAPKCIAEANDLLGTAHLLSDARPVPEKWLLGSEKSLDKIARHAREVQKRQQTYHKRRHQLEQFSGLKVADLPVEELKERFANEYRSFLRRWFSSAYRQDIAAIRRAWVGPKPGYREALQALHLASAYNEEREWFRRHGDSLRERFGPLCDAKLFETDWEYVLSAISWTRELLRHLGGTAPRALASCFQDAGRLRRDARRFAEDLAPLVERAMVVVNELSAVLPVTGIDGSSADKVSFDELKAWLSARIQSIDRLSEWAVFHQARTECSEAGLADFVSTVLTKRIPAELLEKVYTKRLLTVWMGELSKQVPAIARFNGLYREEIIKSYGELDRALIRKAAALVLAKVDQERPDPRATPGSMWSQMRTLLREIQKKRRHKPLRVLFSEAPELIQRLKPCFLMSPLSVSSYLGSDWIHFDVVIFDEAFQIPPWDAICSILRADQVIVAGDNKQLPPTWFFQVELDDPNEADADDDVPLESILDECSALPMFTPCHLRWHYRSRHERLIAFSNRAFYGGRLITFPSPTTEDRSVRYEYVQDGVYDRGGSRTNRAEARRVAELVVQHFEQYGTSRSLGVIAMSIAQERAIDEEIQRLRLANPHLEPCFSEDTAEPFFVKNLENVQGDERDHVILSVGYGPDANGAMSLNFGPINRAGGERRLNVAITRARIQTLVVCSFLPHQLDLTRLTTQNEGVRLLQEYLEYAYTGRFAPITTAGDSTESEFEEAVLQALQREGFEVDTQVGCSGFRIDLAIRHPRREGRYILGIECDGKTYHQAKTARDRDRLRQEVLEKLGWNILRIWSPDWVDNPKAQIARVRREVERLLNQDEVGVAAPPRRERPSSPSVGRVEKKSDVADDSQEEQRQDSLVATLPRRFELDPYRMYVPEQTHDPEEYYQADSGWGSRNALEPIVRELIAIVEVETPIHQDAALRRLASVFGISRVKKRVRSIGLRAIREATRSGRIVLRDGFLWSRDATVATPRRRPDGTWPFTEIAVEELSQVMRLLMQDQAQIYERDLMRETARAFGYERMGVRVEGHLRRAVDLLVTSGEVIRNGPSLKPVRLMTGGRDEPQSEEQHKGEINDQNPDHSANLVEQLEWLRGVSANALKVAEALLNDRDVEKLGLSPAEISASIDELRAAARRAGIRF